jgi:tartrate-resistant acid phosphatase type 5
MIYYIFFIFLLFFSNTICHNDYINNSELNFISFGDWGHKNIHQQKVADQIYNYTQLYDSKFNIVLGDNFYETGVTSIFDPKWEKVYKDVYKGDNPWFVILGNHDYYGNPMSEILYTFLDPRWNLPSNNYVLKYNNLKIIMIDTQLLDTDCSYINSNITSQFIKDSIYKFIENELQTEEKYKIVAGHASVFGIGEHGDCIELKKDLLPMLDKYKVKLYLHGHEHLLQHNRFREINFFGCGSSSKLSKKEKMRFESEFIQNYYLEYGFCFHKIKDNKLINQFINEDGNLLYENIINLDK